MKIWQCAECLRCFGSETAILDHQSLWARLHEYDSEIDEHDGTPWRTHDLPIGDGFEYNGYRVTLVVDSIESGDFVYVRGLGPKGVEMVGTFGEIYVPAVSIQLVRAWAAAEALGIDDNEVSMWEHAHWLTRRWYEDPERLAEERHLMLSMIGLAQVTPSKGAP